MSLTTPGAAISLLLTLRYGYPALSFDDLHGRCFDGSAPLLARTDRMSTEFQTNYVGASIFVSYIIAALAVTLMLIKSLWGMYQRIPQGALSHAFVQRLWLFTCLSLLSFCVLSYNMLSFLIHSYLTWSKMHSGVGESLLQSIWTWMTRSTLFFAFGRELVSSQQSLRWTKVALSASMASNFYMSSLSQLLQIPDMMFYIVVGQILPTSFSVNLFFVAVLLRSQQARKDTSQNDGKKAQNNMSFTSVLLDELPLACSCLYALYLSFLACSIDQLQFISYIVAARILLAIPFLSRLDLASDRCLVQTTVITFALMTWYGDDVRDLFVSEEMELKYAVKALGLDYLVLSASILVWVLLASLLSSRRHGTEFASVKAAIAKTE